LSPVIVEIREGGANSRFFLPQVFESALGAETCQSAQFLT
jgi:hypothetical protein